MAATPVWHLREHAHLLLFRLLYLFLRLYHHVSALIRFPFPSPTRTPASFPRHVALSGALAADYAKLAALITLAARRGARHVSVHDPWTPLDPDTLAAHLLRAGHPAFSVRKILPDAAAVSVASHPRCPPDAEPPVRVTVVHPGAGRAALVRAARTLARLPHPALDVPSVTRWLDDTAEGMLPSEPDVVVVFAPQDRACQADVLHGFPVWQLRLTQLRFFHETVAAVDARNFLSVVADAAKAPKRFGR